MQIIRLNKKQNDIISEFIAKKVVYYSKYEQIDGIYLTNYIDFETNKPHLKLTLILEYFRKDGSKIDDVTDFKQKPISIPNTDNIRFSVSTDSAINYTYSSLYFNERESIKLLGNSILLKDNSDNYYTNFIESINNKEFINSAIFEPPLNIHKKIKKQN